MRRPCSIRLFWETLATSTKKWFVDPAGAIRRRGSPGERICPICEVARLLMPGALFFENGNPASWAIGLRAPFSFDAMGAADVKTSMLIDPKRRAIRRKLLRVLGLKERE